MEHNKYYHQLEKEINEYIKQQEKLEEVEKKLENKVDSILIAFIKNKDKTELQKLAAALPDCITKFYVFQAIEELNNKPVLGNMSIL